MSAILVNSQIFNRFSSVTYDYRWVESAKDSPIEHLFFNLDDPKSSKTIFYGDKGPLASFIESGLVIDLSSSDLENIYELDQIFNFHIYSSDERIRKCNALRDHILTRIDIPHRFCGPEKETIFNDHFLKNNYEAVGLYDRGIFYDSDTGFSCSERYFLKDDTFIHEMFNQCERLSDVGQRKLFSLFGGFVSRYPLIYIGSAPGEGWLSHPLLNLTKVLSIDPRPLERRHPNVTHIQEALTSENFETLLPIIRNFIQLNGGTADLFDDVRSDYPGEDAFQQMLREEWELKVRLVQSLSPLLSRCLLKLNTTNIQISSFPQCHYRLFPAPYCIERQISELRLFFAPSHRDVGFGPPSGEAVEWALGWRAGVKKKDCQQFDSPLLSNINLFLNTFNLRVIKADYIHNHRSLTPMDVNLFTLNLNAPAHVREYFAQLEGAKRWTIATYFTPEFLAPEEYPVREIESIPPTFWCVVDSRVFISEYQRGLYILVPPDYRVFRNEAFCGESFRIKRIMSNISSLGIGPLLYHSAKRQTAQHYGYQFYRLPFVGSIIDEPITPSGHALRIAFQYHKYGDISLIGYYSKTIFNISYYAPKARKRHLPPDHQCSPFRIFSWSRIPLMHIEKRSNEFWHSEVEWKAGFLSGFLLSTVTRSISRTSQLQFTNIPDGVYGIFDVLYDTVNSPHGFEVHEWKKRSRFNQMIKYSNVKFDPTFSPSKEIFLPLITKSKLTSLEVPTLGKYLSLRLDSVYIRGEIINAYVCFLRPYFVIDPLYKFDVTSHIVINSATQQPEFSGELAFLLGRDSDLALNQLDLKHFLSLFVRWSEVHYFDTPLMSSRTYLLSPFPPSLLKASFSISKEKINNWILENLPFYVSPP